MSRAVILNYAPDGRPEPEKLSPLAAVWRGMEALLGRIKAIEAKPPAVTLKGDPGAPGNPGAPGLGIAMAAINTAGELVLVFTDGSEQNLGRVVGRDGADGKAAPSPLPNVGEEGAPRAQHATGAPGEGGVTADKPRLTRLRVTKKAEDGTILELEREEL